MNNLNVLTPVLCEARSHSCHCMYPGPTSVCQEYNICMLLISHPLIRHSTRRRCPQQFAIPVSKLHPSQKHLLPLSQTARLAPHLMVRGTRYAGSNVHFSPRPTPANVPWRRSFLSWFPPLQGIRYTSKERVIESPESTTKVTLLIVVGRSIGLQVWSPRFDVLAINKAI